MDLVVCPSCQFTFSPTPGQAVKCPACMKAITPTSRPVSQSRKPASVPAARKPASPKPTRTVAKPVSNASTTKSNKAVPLLFLAVGLLVGVVGIGLSVWFLRLKTPSPESVAIAPPVPPAPIEVVVPKTILPPATPKFIKDPEPDLPPTKSPPEPETKKPNPGKVRIVETNTLPEVDFGTTTVKKKMLRDVPGVTPEKVNAAVDSGAAYLLKTAPQWFVADTYRLGHINLGALTLLECKTAPAHPVIQQAAALTRQLIQTNDKTYDISTSLLFLDRLGDPQDKYLIRILAARLIAGQEAGGGWAYKCPLLTPAETAPFLTFLHKTKPANASVPFDIGQQTKDSAKPLETRDPAEMSSPLLDPFGKNALAPGSDQFPLKDPKASELVLAMGDDLVSMPPKVRPKNRLGNSNLTVKAPVGNNSPLLSPTGLSPRLLTVPAVVNQGREKEQMILTSNAQQEADQSNTQFALLGLWVARRHGVASDRALLLAELSQRRSQLPSGSWHYQPSRKDKIAPTMTCVGLLGLALGHAVHHQQPGMLTQSLKADTSIAKAIAELSEAVGNPVANFEDAPRPQNLYFLWSLERVAVLYNLSTFNGRDWYGWGAQMLLKNQNPTGHWIHEGYPGANPHLDTCFALLFLVRSNLVQEITEQIRLQIPLGESP